MTIVSNTARESYACNGSTTVFAVNIQAYLATDFLVILTNTTTGGGINLVLNSDYTLVSSGTLAPPFWTLTTQTGQFVSPYISGYTLQVILNPTEVQQSQYVQGQAFSSLAIQTNLDRLTQMAIRSSDQIARTLRQPDSDVTPLPALPPGTAWKIFSGQGSSGGSSGGVASGDVRNYDAVSGTDCTTAVAAAGAANLTVVFPAGTWVINSVPSLPPGVIFQVLPGATFTGTGAGTLGLFTGVFNSQVEPNATNGELATSFVHRIANYTGGPVGNTPAALRVQTDVSAGVTEFEWTFLSIMNNSANAAGQNVAIYGQAHKVTTTAGPTWAGTLEAREPIAIANPTSQLIGLEVDCLANGTDNNLQRLGIDVVCSRSSFTGPANTVTYGVRVQNNSDGANSLVNICFATIAYCNVGFDTASATTVAAAFRMATNQNITFDGNGAGTNQIFYDGQGIQYKSGGNTAVRLNGSGSIQFGGNSLPIALQGSIASTATAGGGQATPGTVLGYLNIAVNGTNAKIPYYSV